MKTEEKETAKIASDVKKATRERAEAEHVEATALKRELERERSEYIYSHNRINIILTVFLSGK